MATRKIEKGAEVIMHGRILTVTETFKKADSQGTKHEMVRLGMPALVEARSGAHTEIEVPRKRQLEINAELEGIEAEIHDQDGKPTKAQIRQRAKLQDEWEDCREEIERLDALGREASFEIKVRASRFEWWEARGCWYHPGQVLSDAQHKAYRKLNGGKKVDPIMQRAAWDILEEKGLLGNVTGIETGQEG